jgi:hypothetical protein
MILNGMIYSKEQEIVLLLFSSQMALRSGRQDGARVEISSELLELFDKTKLDFKGNKDI